MELLNEQGNTYGFNSFRKTRDDITFELAFLSHKNVELISFLSNCLNYGNLRSWPLHILSTIRFSYKISRNKSVNVCRVEGVNS